MLRARSVRQDMAAGILPNMHNSIFCDSFFADAAWGRFEGASEAAGTVVAGGIGREAVVVRRVGLGETAPGPLALGADRPGCHDGPRTCDNGRRKRARGAWLSCRAPRA